MESVVDGLGEGGVVWFEVKYGEVTNFSDTRVQLGSVWSWSSGLSFRISSEWGRSFGGMGVGDGTEEFTE